jgi:adenylosuccinate lyase
VLELGEPFTEGQKGSSSMPHKRNPILSENLSGLARLLRSYAISSLENIPLWHERDISHSSVERVIAPDASILIDFMLFRLHGLIEALEIYPENMKKNLGLTRGLIFSEKILLKLIDKGLSREKAYGLVQRNAMKSFKGKENFKNLIFKDKEITTRLSKNEIEECFDVSHDLKNVDYIFQRVFRD